MVGLILNEEGSVTYPYYIFAKIESYVRSLNWRISNLQCCGPIGFIFPFEETDDYFIDGDSLFES